MEHAFDPELAQEVGINAAVILRHITYWCLRNGQCGKNKLDGRVWMFDTMARLSSNFPYLSQATVARALRTLKDAGYIEVGRYNTLPFDQTRWYAATDKAYAIYSNCLSASAQDEQLSTSQNDEAIPQDIPQDIPPLIPPEVDAVIKQPKHQKPPPPLDFNPVLFDKFWQAYPRKVNKDVAVRAWTRLHVDQPLFDAIMDGLRRSIQFDHTFRDKSYTPHASTWLNGKRWLDEFDLPAPETPPPRNTAFDELRSIAREDGAPPPPISGR